jgi:hypothetical protein
LRKASNTGFYKRGAERIESWAWNLGVSTGIDEGVDVP